MWQHRLASLNVAHLKNKNGKFPEFLRIFHFPFQCWPGCILPDMSKVIRGKSEGTFKAGIALNFSSTQETWRNIPTIMIIQGRNDKYKWKIKVIKNGFLFRIYSTIHDQIDESLFCNGLYFSYFGGKKIDVVAQFHPWFKFFSLCSKLIIDYNTPKQRKINFKPRIKLNHIKYPHFPKLNYRVFSRSLFISLRKQITLNDHSP